MINNPFSNQLNTLKRLFILIGIAVPLAVVSIVLASIESSYQFTIVMSIAAVVWCSIVAISIYNIIGSHRNKVQSRNKKKPRQKQRLNDISGL